MKFEEILRSVGEFGRYQKRVIFLLCLPAISCGLHRFVWVFLGAIPKFRCRLPNEHDEAGYVLAGEILNMSYPWDYGNNRYDQCRMLKVNFTREYYAGAVPATEATVCGNGYVFDTSRYLSSVATQYELVCHQLVLHATTQALFMLGTLIGSVLYGAFSDRCGRRPAFLLSLALLLICGILAGVIPEYYTFTALRMVIGGSASGAFLTAYCLGLEIASTAKRTLVGTLFQCFFAVGYLLTALFAYLIRDWQILQITVSAVGIYFISYYWLVPESPRWLLQKGKMKEAEVILRSMAKENKCCFPDTLFSEENVASLSMDLNAPKVKWSFKQLAKYSNVRTKFAIVFLNWFVTSGVYYGISLNTSNLGGNDYVNFMIFAATEIPAYLSGYVLLDRFGRRSVHFGSLLVGGITLILIPFTIPLNQYVAIVLAMVGKFFLTSAYNVIYIFSAELMPTVMRNAGMGACSLCARVGGIIAPYLLLLESQWKPLPYVIFGAASIVAGAAALYLPETTGRRLPETMDDGEQFGKNRKMKYVVRPPAADDARDDLKL